MELHDKPNIPENLPPARRSAVKREFITSAEKEIKALLGDENSSHSTFARIHRFNQEITSLDHDARTFKLARRIAQRLRDKAADQDIPLNGVKWLPPEDFAPHAGRLTKLFNSVSVSPAYRAWQKERTAQLTESLAAAPRFRHMVEDWLEPDEEKLKDNILWLSTRQHNIFSQDIGPAPLIYTDIFKSPRLPGQDRLIRGSHSRPQHENRHHCIEFNIHPDTGFTDPAEGLTVIFHENLHATQWMLAEQFAKRALSPDHELYRDARLFFLACNEPNSYLAAIKPVYLAHPTEEDTFRATHDYIEMLEKNLSPYKISLRRNHDGGPAP